MADNVAITAGAGTNVATDEIGGIHYQRVKPSHGADGSAVDTSAAAPLPVADPATHYETVAAGAADQVLGAAGAVGDRIMGVLVVPATTSPGAISIKDGVGSAISIFTGGASSVSNLVPFMVPLGIASLSGAWSISCGANVSALAVGRFT